MSHLRGIYGQNMEYYIHKYDFISVYSKVGQSQNIMQPGEAVPEDGLVARAVFAQANPRTGGTSAEVLGYRYCYRAKYSRKETRSDDREPKGCLEPCCLVDATM